MKAELIQLYESRVVTHIFFDTVPNSGSSKRLQYFTQDKETKEYFLGFSVRPYGENVIKDWVQTEQIFPLTTPCQLKLENDLWIDSTGMIFQACGYDPKQIEETRQDLEKLIF